MAISGLGVGLAADRLSELLGLVTSQNPFQRRRLEALDLGDDPALSDLPPLTKLELVHDQERNPPFGTNLTYPLERYTQLHQTSGTTGPPLRVLDTRARTGAGGVSASRTRLPSRGSAPRIAWPSPTRSARTSSSGPRRRGCRRSARWRSRSAAWAPRSGSRRSTRWRPRRSGARRRTRCACSRWPWSSGSSRRSTRSSACSAPASRADRCPPCARASRRASARAASTTPD